MSCVVLLANMNDSVEAYNQVGHGYFVQDHWYLPDAPDSAASHRLKALSSDERAEKLWVDFETVASLT